jgi:CheY-like chemotaxis protein
MPRLLLVDDNPSIHRIAESLLAPTDVELVCVDSAAEALDRIGRGERFDVALVDTAMPGMDGWTLLERFRTMEETLRMPIALMAGVLDPVDPAKLAKAPIQGFLKKPIELRELGDRVKTLLATPVVVGPSPFSTVPATPAKDLLRRAEASLPEFRPAPEEELAELLDASFALPAPEEEDLLVLTAEDLWPEEPVAAAQVVSEATAPAPAPADVQLDLEELDLESLQDLGTEAPVPLPEPESEPLTLPEPTWVPEPSPVDDDQLVTLSGLEELETLPTQFTLPSPLTVPATLPGEEDFLASLPPASSFLGETGEVPAAGFAAPAPLPEAPEAPALMEAPIPEAAAPAATGQIPDASGQPATPEQVRALLLALMADPVLMDALVKALVVRMGDQVLREIAWEVMPDLAGRLQQ